MAVKFNLRMCLQLMDQGISLNTISKQYCNIELRAEYC